MAEMDELQSIVNAVSAECLHGWWPSGDDSNSLLDWRPFVSRASIAFVGVVPHRRDGRLSLAVLFRAAPHWDVLRAYAVGLDESKDDFGWPEDERAGIAREELFGLWEDIESGDLTFDGVPAQPHAINWTHS